MWEKGPERKAALGFRPVAVSPFSAWQGRVMLPDEEERRDLGTEVYCVGRKDTGFRLVAFFRLVQFRT